MLPTEEKFTEEEKKQMRTNLENWVYRRALELLAVVTEEWGESIKEINNFLWKADSVDENDFYEKIDRIRRELRQIDSPLEELDRLFVKIRVRKIFYPIIERKEG